MAFRAQRLANKYPTWTKVRRDPSSMGSRLLSVYAEYFDFADAELLKLRDELNLLRPHMGRGEVERISLDAADLLPVVITTGGETTYTYPTTVTGEFSTGTKTLTRVDNLEAVLWPPPDEILLDSTIPVTDFLIWDSTAAGVFNSIASPDRLKVVVEGSEDYFRRQEFKNRYASGFHMLVLKGKDHNGLDFIEHLRIPDDGVYWTKNIISVLDSATPDGFDGQVLVYLNTPTTDTRMLQDPYHLAMSDREEGALKLALDSDVLKSYVQRIKRGANYRTGDGLVVDNDELIWEQALADIAGTALTGIVDIAINNDTSRLYALTSAGTVYVYDHGLTPFTPPVDQSLLTLDTFMEILPLAHWATLSETMTMFTWFLKPRFQVVYVIIKRRSPAGVVEYLQSDLTWTAVEYRHLGDPDINKLPEDSWTNLTFTNEFTEYGEWEFYTTVHTQSGDTTTVTKVMVDKLTALKEVATGVVTPTSLYFSESGQLCVTDASNIYKFDEVGHTYLANGPSQQLFLRESYTSVEVTL